jgi:hypothetical protein
MKCPSHVPLLCRDSNAAHCCICFAARNMLTKLYCEVSTNAHRYLHLSSLATCLQLARVLYLVNSCRTELWS